jgi:hypothetical protein
METRVKDIIIKLKEIHIAEKHLESLLKILDDYVEEIETFENEIFRVNHQISKLGKMSIASIYHTLLGDKSSKLEILKSHYLKLAIKRNELKNLHINISWEIDLLTIVVANKKALKEELNFELLNFEGTLQSNELKTYKILIESMTGKLNLIKELDEAINQAEMVNRKFNKILKFIDLQSQKIFREIKELHRFEKIKVSHLDKYQEHISSLKHTLLKFEIELNDVYNAILNGKEYNNTIVVDFMNE